MHRPVRPVDDRPARRRAFTLVLAKRDAPRNLLWIGVIVVGVTLLNEAIPPPTLPLQLAGSLVIGSVMIAVSRLLDRPATPPAVVPWAFAGCVAAFVGFESLVYLVHPLEANLAYVIIAMTSFGPLTFSWRPFLVLGPIMFVSVVGAMTAVGQADLAGWASGVLASLLIGAIMLRLRLSLMAELSDAQSELATSTAHYRLLAENAADVVVLADAAGVVSWVSSSVTGVLGWRPDQIVRRSVHDLVPADHLAEIGQLWERAETGEPASGRVEALSDDGLRRWVTVTVRAARDSGGGGAGMVLALHDAQREHAAEQAVAHSERQFRLAMASAAAGMAVVALDRSLIAVNPALCRLTGRSEEWLLAHRVPDILHPDDDVVDREMREAALSGRENPATRDKRLITARKRIIFVEHSVGVLRDEAGQPLSYVSQFVDVTSQRMTGKDLLFQASHDPLTNLVNRDYLMRRMAVLLDHPAEERPSLGVLFADLDGLKGINDTHGHAIGDQVIRYVGQVIRKRTRREDVVARISGDEFVIALVGVESPDSAIAVGEKILHGLAELPAAVAEDGTPLYVSVSVGAAVAREGESAADLLRRADRAMYRAKRSGRGRVVCHDERIDEEWPAPAHT